MRKPDFCLCENKGTDQLHSNCEADQRLCFHYTDCTITLLNPKFQAFSLFQRLYSLVCVRCGRKCKLLVFSCEGPFQTCLESSKKYLFAMQHFFCHRTHMNSPFIEVFHKAITSTIQRSFYHFDFTFLKRKRKTFKLTIKGII